VQRAKARVIPARHELTSQIIVWIGRIKLLRMTPSQPSVLLNVCALAVLNSLILGLFLFRWWVPLLPPVLAWGLCSTVMTAYGAHQERQRVLQS
jgi:CHASE2 domain-containing sensor protein